MAKKVSRIDVMQFKGLVVSRAVVYYRMLPAHWKSSIDLSDFVQMGMACLVARMKAYDPARGAISTLVYTAIDNCYKGLFEKISYKKRAAEVVDFETMAYSVLDTVAKESLDLLLESEISVKKLHRQASFELLCFLDNHFFHQDKFSMPKLHSQKFQALRREFQSLANETGVSIDAYRLAIALHHARTMQVEGSL